MEKMERISFVYTRLGSGEPKITFFDSEGKEIDLSQRNVERILTGVGLKKKSPSYTASDKIIETDSRVNETDPHDSLRTGTLPVVEGIEKLDRRLYSDYDNGVGVHYIYPDNEELMGKLNEVITAVNKLTNKK